MKYTEYSLELSVSRSTYCYAIIDNVFWSCSTQSAGEVFQTALNIALTFLAQDFRFKI